MLTLFGTIIVFIVWIPVKFIKMVSPDFLPYRVFAISDEPLNHVSLELVTLQGNGPVFLESHEILCKEFYWIIRTIKKYFCQRYWNRPISKYF